MGDKETSGSTQIAELTAQLASISLGLPSFWSTHPDAWFINIESQFALANITREETKFHKVVAALPEDIATQVLDITQSSYQAGNYTKLKTAILKLFTKSKAKRLDELLECANIQNMKPSAILRKLRNLTGATNPADRIKLEDDDFKQLFIRALPRCLQGPINIISPDHTVTELAEKADRYYESNPPQPNSIAAIQHPPTSAAEISAVQDEIAALRKAIAKTNTSRAALPKPKRIFQPTNRPLLCWYHAQFGDQARKCDGQQSGCAMYTPPGNAKSARL